MNPLEQLAKRLKQAASNPPVPSQLTLSVPAPRALMSARDSRGRVRQANVSTAQARQALRQQARERLIDSARADVINKAKEALK